MSSWDVSSAKLENFIGTVYIQGSANVDDSIRLTVNDSGDLVHEKYDLGTDTWAQETVSLSAEDIRKLDSVQTTGLLQGGLVFGTIGGTTMNWTAGSGQVADYSDPTDPVITEVTWPEVIAHLVTNVATDGTTLFGYDKDGNIIETLAYELTATDVKNNIYFGSATHIGGLIVAINTAPVNLAYDRIGAFKDFFNFVIGPANIDGNIYGPNGANLSLDVIGGNAYMLGANFRNDTSVADVVPLPSGTAITFFRLYREADPTLTMTYSTPTTFIDPTQYDDGSGTLQTVTAGYWTIQRIFRGRTGQTLVAYGQQEFATKALALEALGQEPFTEKMPLPFTLYRCSLVVAQSATDLSDTAEAEFFAHSSFRVGGAQSATSTIPGVTSPGGPSGAIQYNNSSVFGGEDNFYYDDTAKVATIKPDVGGNCSFDVDNSSGIAKLIMGYDEGTDATSIIAPTTNLVLATSDNIVLNNNVGIKTSTPHAELQLSNTNAARKIVLYESVDNDYQFTGFGVSGTILLKSHTATTAGSFQWEAGTSATTSDRLMRLDGTGELLIGESSLICTEISENAGTNYIYSRTNPLHILTDSASALTLGTNSTPALIIDGTTQYVNIPDAGALTVGDDDDLQISHDGITSLITTSSGDIKIQNTDTNGDIYIQLPTTTENDRFFVEDSASGLLFYVGGSGQAAFTNNLGIGRETPATSILHVYENTTSTDTTAGVRIQNAGTGDALLRFVAGAQTVTMGVDNSATDTFRISMGESFNSGVAITIDSLEDITTGGRLGISKAPVSPYVLDVDTSLSTKVRIRDDKAVTFEAGNYGVSSTDLYFNRGDVGVNQSEFVMYNIDDNFFAERFFKFAYTGTAGGLTIQNTTNNVGIGIDLPVSTLHVVESTTSTGIATGLTVENTSTGDAMIQLVTSDERWIIRNDNSNNDRLIIGDDGDNARIVFDVTQKVRIDNRLVVGDADNTGVEITESGGVSTVTGQTNSLVVGTDSASDFTLQTDSIDGIKINGTDQYVSVGQGTALTQLHVFGDATIDGVVYPEKVIGYIKQGETGFAERHISTGDFIDTTISLTATGTIYGAWWGKEGTRLYVTTNSAYIYQYDLTVPYDLTTATFTASNNFTDPNNSDGYTLWNDDGSKFWHGGRGTRTVTLTTPWEISGIASDTGNFTLSFQDPLNMYDLRWNFDGTKIIGVGRFLNVYSGQSFLEWDCTTPYLLTSRTSSVATSYAFPSGVPTGADVVKGFDISPDGMRVYLSAHSLGTEYEVALETAWDLSSGTLVNTVIRGVHSDIKNYSMIPDASGMVSVTPAGTIVQKKYGLEVNGYRVTTEADDLNTNTGWLEGGALSINSGDNTLVDVTAGKARICDYTDPLNPAHTIITWDAQTIDPELDTNWNKWVGVQESATPGIGEFVFDVEFTQLEKRSIAIIGRVWGVTATGVVVGTGNYATPGFDQGNFGSDLSYALGSFNKEGNVYSANGANLTLNKSAGKSFRFAANVAASPLAPHNIVDASQTAISSYYYILSSSTSADIQTDIDPDNYDNAGTKTAVPTDKYTLQRLYYYPVSQVLTVSYGQEVFDTMVSAIGAAGEEIVDIEQSLIEGSILRGWIALKQGATALNDSSQALFKTAQNLNEPHALGMVGTSFRERSFTIADVGASGDHWFAGFYSAPAASVTLTIGGTVTQTYGTAGRAVGAHAFVVFGGTGDGSLVLTVSGTSVTDDGVRTPGDSEDIYSGISAVNDYWETTRKWLGQITYTLTGTTGSYVFNYGFAKYEDFANTDFTVTDFEVTGRGGGNETDLDIILYHHSAQNWTYSAAAFAPGGTKICSLSTDYSTDNNLATGEDFAYKRTNLTTAVEGSALEGVVVNVVTAINNSIESGSIHIGTLV